jgi:putative aldouronate transport system substrate-binding protein
MEPADFLASATSFKFVYALSEMWQHTGYASIISKNGVTTPDGNIYVLPGLDGCWHCYWPTKSWINEDWLAAVNMDMPTTTEEYEKVLLAFKNDDPNGNGKPDEIPFSGYTSQGGDWGNPITFLIHLDYPI